MRLGGRIGRGIRKGRLHVSLRKKGKSKQDKEIPNRIPREFVILGFIIVQPVGMLLHGLRKLQDIRNLTRDGRRMLSLAAVFISIFFMLFSQREDATDILLFFYFFGSLGLIALTFAIIMFTLDRRYRKYKAAVTTHHLTQISDIAAAVGQSKEDAVRTLRRMTAAGFFPDPVLDIQRMVFRPDRNEATVEQMRAIQCSGCGVTILLVEGRRGICEYCGTSY